MEASNSYLENNFSTQFDRAGSHSNEISIPNQPNQSIAGVKEQAEASLDLFELPPFPEDVPIAPLLRISLTKLAYGSEEEINKLWKACCDLGFFYLDLRDETSGLEKSPKSPEENELTQNVWEELDMVDSAAQDADFDVKPMSTTEHEPAVDGEQLLQDAENLFNVGKKVFELPVEEKIKYDLKDQGSYFGYKGYGQGIIDAHGTKDRNEFYNVYLNILKQCVNANT